MASGLSPESYAYLMRELIEDAKTDGVVIWIRPNFGSGYQLVASRAEDVTGRGIEIDSDRELVQSDG